MINLKGKISENPQIAAGLLGCAGGLVLGYLASFLFERKRATRKAEQRITSEVETVKQYYRERSALAGSGKGGDPDDRSSAVGAHGGGIGTRTRYAGKTENPEIILETDRPGMSGTSFHANPVLEEPGNEAPGGIDPLAGMPGHDGYGEDDDEDPEDEGEGTATIPVLEQARARPYVISDDEFLDEREEYHKVTLTWYEGDRVLVDEKEVPIRNHAEIAGHDFFSRFGERSGDPYIVYVRNDRLMSDFEITRKEQGYAEAVLNYGKPK